MNRTINTVYFYANNGTGLSHKKHIDKQTGLGNNVGLCGYDHEYAEMITFDYVPDEDEVCKKCLKLYKQI